MISTMRPAPRRSKTSRRSKSSIWGIEMPRTSALLFAIVLTSTGSAMEAPVTRFVPDSVSRAINTVDRPDEVPSDPRTARRTRGRGRAGCWWPWWRRSEPQRQLQQQHFHRDVANNSSRRTNVNASNRSANVNANRSANVNANRNVNVYGGRGGCCYGGNYSSGPSWGGVAAGVAVGAVVGAAANSAYAAPPPTYPPGYVTPPPY